MKDSYFLIVMAFLGLVIGAAAFSFIQDGGQSERCDRLAENMRANQSFNGTLACYPPGVLNVNESEDIVNQTELQCVCRQSYNGNERIFTVRQSN